MNKHLMWMACAAVLATTSCDKSEITESATPQTIRFDGHANKVSKALNAPVERDNFAVFGHYKDATNGKDGEVFTNDKVEYSEKSKWTYSTQNGVTVDSNSVTWTPSWGYIFAAYSPHKTNSTVTFNEDSTVVYNLGEITLTQAQQADWMTSDPEIVSAGSTKGVVRFIFNHISSRLTFKFRLDSQNPQEPQWETKTKITIKKIELLGVSSTNTYNNNEWGKEKEGFTDLYMK